MSINKKILIACSIIFSIFIVLRGETNKYYHSKEVVELNNEITSLANNCKDGQYYISNKGYCTSCPSGYNHSDGARNMKSNCYLITKPGYFVPKPESKPIECRLDAYSEGNVKVYYYQTNSCTMCPDGTGTNWTWAATGKDKCTKAGFRGHDKCTWYDFNIGVGQVFEDWCTYKYGTKTDIKLTNSNPSSLSAVVTNGDEKTNAVITYKGLKPGRATISYTFNGTKDTYTINVLCEDGKLLSSDGKSCLTSCPSGEKADEYRVCIKTLTCKDGEYIKDSKCVSCPDSYNHSDGDRKSINNCYLTTKPGEFVPEPKTDSRACPYSTYSEGNEKVYYGKNNFCKVCPIGTSAKSYGNKSKSACTSDKDSKYSNSNFCMVPGFLELNSTWKGYKALCVYEYGKNVSVTVTSSNTSVVKVTPHNGTNTQNASIEFDPIASGSSTITYKINGQTRTTTMYVKCNDGKLLSSDNKSCVTSCKSGETIDDYKIRCIASQTTTCKDDEELIDGKCVKKTPTTTPVCGSDEELIDGKCVKKETPPPPSCGSDEELINGKCVKKDTQTPTKSCKKDEVLVDGKCVSKKEYPCKPDEKLVNNKCVKVEKKCYKTCDDEYVWGDYENQACYNPVEDITSEEDCHGNEEVKPPVVKEDDESNKTLIFIIVFVVILIIAMFISSSFSNKKQITVSTRKVKKDDDDYNDYSDYYK